MKEPLLELRLFKNMNFSLSLATSAILTSYFIYRNLFYPSVFNGNSSDGGNGSRVTPLLTRVFHDSRDDHQYQIL